jgi:hypothetical protein
MGVKMNTASPILNNPWGLFSPFLTLLLTTLTMAGCAGRHHLARYEFEGHTLVLDAPQAPVPEIITDIEGDLIEGAVVGTAGALFRAATSMAKEANAHRARKKLGRAADSVDVALLVGQDVLPQAARYMRAVPSDDLDAADFVMILRIHRHGIYAGPSYIGGMEYFLDARIELIDNHSGRLVWKKEVGVHEPINRGGFYLFDNVRSARELAEMSEAEMIEALERLSHYTADAIARELGEDLGG